MLDWMDVFTANLLFAASQEVNASERDDRLLEARGARQLFNKLEQHYNRNRED